MNQPDRTNRTDSVRPTGSINTTGSSRTHQILCSTGALIGRPNGRDYRLLKEIVPKLECDGLELMIYPDWYTDPDALISFLKPLGFRIPVLHCEKALAEHITRGGEEEEREALRLFRINCRIAGALGADRMVFHLWNGVISDSRFENNLRVFGMLRRTAEEYGVDLLVENVICHKDPMTHWKELREAYPGIHFVFDTKMADFHRQLDLLYQDEYDWLWKENHIRHYHVNDYGGGYMDWNNLKVLPVGAGHIDFDKFFSFIRTTGYQGDFTLEATGFDQQGMIHYDMLNGQIGRVRTLLDETGRQTS